MREPQKQNVTIFEQHADGSITFYPESYVKALKNLGVLAKERVEMLRKIVFPILSSPEYQRRMDEKEQAKREEFENNPNIRGRFVKDYKLREFSPIVGRFMNEHRDKSKRLEDNFFYDFANQGGAVPWIKEKMFHTYHYISGLAITGAILYLVS